MNKFGFISSIFTFILLVFQYFPLGLYFGKGDNIYLWLIKYLNEGSNPWITSYAKVPLQIFHYNSKNIYLWGIVSDGNLQLWYEIHILSFFFLALLPFVAVLLAWIGCAKEKKSGKTLIKVNFYFILFAMVYCVLGITLFSKDILGFNVSFYDFLFHLDFGFYLLFIDLIFALIAVINHPIE